MSVPGNLLKGNTTSFIAKKFILGSRSVFFAIPAIINDAIPGIGLPITLKKYISQAVKVTGENPILIDSFISDAIEFDYCCCHACFALSKEGIETIMINCNPETVSTDYDTSDRLYFEPLTVEHVMEIIVKERSNGNLLGVIIQQVVKHL